VTGGDRSNQRILSDVDMFDNSINETTILYQRLKMGDVQ